MKDRQLKIFAWTIFALALSTLILFGVLAFSNYIADRTPDLNVPDEFFGVLSSTIGLAIAASASIIAILLAYNALHSADIQTTTVALQEFRGEIDAFVSLANEYYETSSRLVPHALKLQKLSEDISFLASEETETALTRASDIRISHSETLKDYSQTLIDFRTDVATIQRLLIGSGNIFFRDMMHRNYEKFSSYTDNLIVRCHEHPSGDGQHVIPEPLGDIHMSTSRTKKDPAIIKQLGKFASCFPLMAFSELYSDEYNQRQSDTIWLASSLLVGEHVFVYDVLEEIRALSKFLPCVVSTRDFDMNSESDIAATGKPYKKSELDQALDNIESAEDYVLITSRSKYCLNSYSDILPFYLAMADPISGIDAVRSFFIKFGAKEETLRLYIDTHAARLMFNYRGETDILFNPCVGGVELG